VPGLLDFGVLRDVYRRGGSREAALRDHARGRARKAKGAVGRRRHNGRRNASKKRQWKRPLRAPLAFFGRVFVRAMTSICVIVLNWE
jgi:hypothetical protein